MPVQKLKSFLDANSVRYVTMVHSRAFTAQEIAASAHIPGKEMAKTVMVKVDGKLAMAVVPASLRVSIPLLRSVTGAKNVDLASETEFKKLFPDCEPGAMPPFGNLWGFDVYVASRLAEDDEIFFNAGTHTELVKLKYAEFERLVKPKVLEFAVR